MSAPPKGTLTSMLPEAASTFIHYPQFYSVPVPLGTGAQLALEGVIQPFINDNSARNFIRVLESEQQFRISEGTIVGNDGKNTGSHWADPLLIDMAVGCRVLVLSFAPPVHPRSYLLSPEFSSSFLSYHPHPRADLEIRVGRKTLVGLCVYSAAEFAFASDIDRLVQYLDQVSTFVARHLIWLRTRRLYQIVEGKKKLIYCPKPRELITDNEVGVRNAAVASVVVPIRQFWDGYWPGRIAQASGRGHLALLNPEKECWCGSGQSYRLCHRAQEELFHNSSRR
jgi:hypothetical protein